MLDTPSSFTMCGTFQFCYEQVDVDPPCLVIAFASLFFWFLRRKISLRVIGMHCILGGQTLAVISFTATYFSFVDHPRKEAVQLELKCMDRTRGQVGL